MRKNVFLLIAIASFTIISKNYGQKLFAPLGAEWKYFETCYEQDPQIHIVLRVEGEQFLGGKDCSIINGYFKGEGISNWTRSEDSLFVYEESGKVYFYHNNNFYKLFDFVANVGDTINYFYPSNYLPFTNNPNGHFGPEPLMQKVVVEKIDTIQFGSQLRKRLKLQPTIDDIIYQEAWIEGIGSVSSRFAGQFGIFTGACWGGLSCYGYQDTIYQNWASINCDFTSAVNDQIDNVTLKIFPNPTTGLVTIDSDLSYDDITIFGPDGRKLPKNRCLSGAETTDSCAVQLDLSSYPNGIYNIRLTKGMEWVIHQVMLVK